MKIHHLNCGTLCPMGGHIMDGKSEGLGESLLACHCLLIESSDGLVLVDTGLGLQDIDPKEERLSRFFKSVCRPKINLAQTAIRQILALGFATADVKHIVLTHLDFDHAGGIEDFPNAMVHVYKKEWLTARNSKGFVNSRRYRPKQWDKNVKWQTYEDLGEPWFGFESVRELKGLPPEILMVPLIGHTWGHCGVAVDTSNGWLLHAGDAYFYHKEMDLQHPHSTPGLELYQTMMEVDRLARLSNQDKLRQLLRDHSKEVQVMCSHDASEFARFSHTLI